MKQDELVKGLKVLGIAYGKEFSKEECATYYEFLQDYNYETFKKAIKSIIRKSKFIPKISDLIEECEAQKEQLKYDVIEYMHACNYFKDVREYDKAVMWYSKGILPTWLKEDMKKYYKLMNQDRLTNASQFLIE